MGTPEGGHLSQSAPASLPLGSMSTKLWARGVSPGARDRSDECVSEGRRARILGTLPAPLSVTWRVDRILSPVG